MKIIMKDENITSITQLREFMKGVDGAVDFSPEVKGYCNKQKMYDWISNVLLKFGYWRIKKKEKKIILSYICKVTNLSRSQVKLLVKRKKKGKLIVRKSSKNKFFTVYNPMDIGKLIETDNVHGRLSGPATKKILEREYNFYNNLDYEKISNISVSHIYNLREKRQYKSNSLFISKTRAVNRNIGERKKPQPEGKPGYLRLDSVHQGDKDKEKGVYYINAVDEVVQWEIVRCTKCISEFFLEPILEELIETFPFKIINFHSDNGSEYINHVVEKLLNKLMINKSKSRSRRTNDNALVESNQRMGL